MNKEALFIHIDGMDLAGKTTTANGIVNKIGNIWNVRSNSLSDNNPIYLLADSLRKENAYTSEILGHLYTVAMRADINTFIWPNINTIQDSTIILRSLAYHTVSGNINITTILDDILPKHPNFDASIVLTADIETRKQRLESRKLQHPDEVAEDDLMVIKNPNKFLAMEKCLIDIAVNKFNSTIINTSLLSPEEMVNTVIGKLPKEIQQRLSL